ncbi:MAG: hypothetical protein WDO68_03805 [Gammaproteobacteria bacterium]
MKLLRTNEGRGEYLDGAGNYVPIEKIRKEDLLRLADATLNGDVADFDEYDESAIKNRAHQVIYKSVSSKLRDLRNRRDEFKDAAARLFLEDYERYQGSIAK